MLQTCKILNSNSHRNDLSSSSFDLPDKFISERFRIKDNAPKPSG